MRSTIPHAALLTAWTAAVILAGPWYVAGLQVGGRIDDATAMPEHRRVPHDSLIVHGDSLAVLAQSGVARADLEAALAESGLRWVRALDEDIVLFALERVLEREQIFQLGRSIRRSYSAVVMQAGPLVRHAYGDAPLVATDQIIVQFSAAASPSEIVSLTSQLGARLVYRTPLANNHYLVQAGDASAADGIELAELFARSALTVSAIPNYLGGAGTQARHPAGSLHENRPGGGRSRMEVGGSGIPDAECDTSSSPRTPREPNDPLFRCQWHLRNPGQTGADIGVLEAWEHTPRDPEIEIVIAVIEANRSIDFNHPDLAGNRWSDPEDLTVHGRDFSGCNTPPEREEPGHEVPDCKGAPVSAPVSGSLYHGTAVAGLAAAVGNNGIGVSGVCPRCKFMSIVAPGSAYAKDLAFKYAAGMGARIINVSWTMLSETLVDVLDSLAEQHGSVIVVAVGTDTVGGKNVCTEPYLPSAAGVIAVGASNDHDKRVPRSNWGPCLSVLAPGGASTTEWGISTTDASGPAGRNNNKPSVDCPDLDDLDYTACFGGTSAAAPIVAGIVGLMLSANPSLTHRDVKAILETTADKIDHENANYVSGFSRTHGHGRVNATAAVKCAQNRDLPCLSP